MKPETFRKLAALGLTTEQIAGVLEVMAEEAEARNAKARARWHKWKANKDATNVGKRLPTTANVSKQLARAEDSSSNLEISGQKEDVVTSPSARSKRGERIPDDFLPDIEWAVAQGLSHSEAKTEAAQFIDFWRGKPGKDGLKLDWPGTWRMWVRNYIKRRQTNRATAPPPKPRNAGEAARLELIERGMMPDATSSQHRRLDPGDRGQHLAGPGIARRFAIASGG